MKPAGNPKLAGLTQLRVREILRSQWVGDKKMKDVYYQWLRDHQDAKYTYDAEYRGLVKRR